MHAAEELTALYTAYSEKLIQVRKKASALAGLFSMGDDPRNHSCHDEFYEAVEKWVDDFCASKPTQEQAAEAVQWMLEAAYNHREEETYWYLYAMQGLTRPLIPMLSRDTCESIRTWYADTYPAVDRMPAQKEVYKLLQKHAGQRLSSGSLLRSLFGKE